MEKSLKIVEVSAERVASDERKYFVATLSSGFGQKPVKRTFWQQFKKDEKNVNIPNSQYWERGSHSEALALMKSGELIEGEKVTRTVKPYAIGEGENSRMVDTYTTVIFPGETVDNVFAANDKEIIDLTTGQIVNETAILARNKSKVAEKTEA